MLDTIKQTVKMKYDIIPEKIVELGGGFYGRAYLVYLPFEPYKIVAKLYLYPHFAKKEAKQLSTLSRYALLKAPDVYGVLEKDVTGCSYDVLFMEYLVGLNAGAVEVSKLEENVRKEMCESMVDNLLALHHTTHELGFGELEAEKYCDTWQEHYYPIAKTILKKSKILLEQGQLSQEVFGIMEEAVHKLDEIFYLPIETASLIHGDYNTWNILIDKEKTCVAGFLDPFGCCWADSEFDLYQLDNVNGKEFGLLQCYAKKKDLSPNFYEKRCFYELFTEINHYYDAHVRVDLKAVEKLARRLQNVLK